jgi:flavin reductase (DIM6/NTAB) family NADH-FMN oxidoreductase RutF
LREIQDKVPVPFEKCLYFLHPFNTTLVTCKGKNGKVNVLAVAWIIPVSAKPPLLAMSIRPERYSHELIMEGGEFVVNIPTFKMVKKVVVCGRTSGRNLDKFKKASLSLQKAQKVKAPVISECVAHLECKIVKTEEIGDHTLMIGQIVAAYASDEYYQEVYDLTKFQPCLHLGKNFFTTCIKKSVDVKIDS